MSLQLIPAIRKKTPSPSPVRPDIYNLFFFFPSFNLKFDEGLSCFNHFVSLTFLIIPKVNNNISPFLPTSATACKQNHVFFFFFPFFSSLPANLYFLSEPSLTATTDRPGKTSTEGERVYHKSVQSHLYIYLYMYTYRLYCMYVCI